MCLTIIDRPLLIYIQGEREEEARVLLGVEQCVSLRCQSKFHS